ncbi:MAG: uroporphyrinogen-III decarboxylase-like protein, partial [Planctomycetota bacterium]
MRKETMSPRERWQAVLNRQKPDRVPMDYQATDEFTAKFKKHLNCSTLDEAYARLHIDRPLSVGAKYKGPALAPDTDVFGMKYRDLNYGTGSYRECANHPLADFQSVAEIEKGYRWPSPDW